jgi:hypothetical protein
MSIDHFVSLEDCHGRNRPISAKILENNGSSSAGFRSAAGFVEAAGAVDSAS